MEEIAKNLAIIVTGVLSIWIGDKLKSLKASKKRERATIELKESIQTDTQILACLAVLLHQTCASRIKIYRFHNGGDFYDGTAMRKFSLAYLHLKPGVSGPKPGDLKDLKSSLFTNMLRDMLAKPVVVTWAIDHAPDSFLKSIHEAEGTAWSKVVALRSYKGEMLGFLAVNWIERHMRFSKEMDEHIIECATRVQNLLST